MSEYLQFLLLGLGAGAIYTSIALGLVISYQGSGVINFSQGAIAMYVVYVYDELRRTGDYVFPIVGLPDRVSFGEPTGLLTALSLALGTAVILGLLVHFLVFNPLRHAPLLAKVVASVGLTLILQAICVLRFGTANRSVGTILPNEPWKVPLVDVSVPRDRLWLALIVVVVAALLWALLRFTRFGLATRAAAVEETGAVLIGLSPGRLACGNWVLSCVVTGMLAVLAAPIAGLNSTNFVLFIVPGLACALFGRLQNMLMVTVAGLAIGMFGSTIAKVATWSVFPSWLPVQAAEKGLPFIFIIFTLFLAGSRLPSRGVLGEGRHPPAPLPRRVGFSAAWLVGLALLAIPLLSGPLRLNLYVSLASSILLLSVVLLTGFVGQISLAQAVFAGVAGFTTAKVADQSIGFPFSMLLGALAATGLGLVLAIPALRIRGAQLAVVTMAAGVAMEEFFFKNRNFVGETGAQLVDPPTLFGIDMAANAKADFNRWEFGVLLIAVVTLLFVAAANIRRGSTGRRMLALRSNERAAAAAGIDVTSTKLVAFAIASFVAGLGGAMTAYLRGAISSDSFSVFVSLTVIAFAYLGGIATISGALIGALLAPGGLIVALIDEYILQHRVHKYAVLIGGIALISTAIFNPDGIAGKIAVKRREAHKRRESAHAPAVEPNLVVEERQP